MESRGESTCSTSHIRTERQRRGRPQCPRLSSRLIGVPSLGRVRIAQLCAVAVVLAIVLPFSAIAAPPPPAPPAGLAAKADSSTQVTLTWAASTKAKSYDVYRNGTVKATKLTTTRFVDTTVSGGTTYSYAVTACNANGCSAKSSSVSVTTPSGQPPSVPTGLTATANSSTKVTAAWNAVSGATTYSLYRNGSLRKSGITTTSYADATSGGTTYSYAVTACNANGCSAQSSSVSATTPSGSACSGVSISPGTDIASIVKAFPIGTTFCVQAGTYRLLTEIIVKSGDILIGEPGAILNGSKVVTSFSPSGAYWVAGGQTQQAAVDTGARCLPATYTGCQYSESVFIDDAPMWQVMSLSALSSGEFYFDYGADKIYLADDPTGHKVEASVARTAIWGACGYQDNVTIKGLTVEKFATWPTGYVAAIKPGNGWDIEDNEVRLNHGIGILGSTGTVIRGNYIHDNGQYGVFSSESNGALFENNEIAHNNVEGFDPWNAGGSKFVKNTNLTVRGNYVHHNIGSGLHADTDNIYTLYENNIVQYNTREGIGHETSYDAVIRNNVVQYNDTDEAGLAINYGSNIHLSDSQNVEIYGNTVTTLGDTNAIGLTDSDRGAGLYGTYQITNDYVHDNTITLTSGAEVGLVGNRNPDIYTSAGNRFEDNTYYVSAPTALYWRWSGAQDWLGWQGKSNDLAGHVYQD
jgi:hypothetical protein